MVTRDSDGTEQTRMCNPWPLKHSGLCACNMLSIYILLWPSSGTGTKSRIGDGPTSAPHRPPQLLLLESKTPLQTAKHVLLLPVSMLFRLFNILQHLDICRLIKWCAMLVASLEEKKIMRCSLLLRTVAYTSYRLLCSRPGWKIPHALCMNCIIHAVVYTQIMHKGHLSMQGVYKYTKFLMLGVTASIHFTILTRAIIFCFGCACL